MKTNDQHILNNYDLICPACKSCLELDCDSEGLTCMNDICKKVYPLINNIPSILIDGFEMKKGEGFYEKILGGTMEDGTTDAFVRYDASIRVHILKKFLKSESMDGDVLDLCCSKAPFYSYLSQIGYTSKVYGVDLLLHQLEIAKSRGVKAVHANALKIPFLNEKFSTVIFSEALVHLMLKKDQKSVFEEIFRVMKPNGTLLITVSNFRAIALQSYINDSNMLKSEHCTFFTRQDILSLIKDKFEIINIRPFAFYYLLPNLLRRSFWALKMFDFIMRIVPSLAMVDFIKLKKI